VRAPGLLVLVFGPSGAGKDSVLGAAAAAQAMDAGLVFARRAITRAAGVGGEEHEPIGWPEFAARCAAGRFLLCWEANGHGYGIADSYAGALDNGLTVIASVSRTVLAKAARLRWPILPVRITAPSDVLAERLSRRGRESREEIVARLDRARLAEPALSMPVTEIVNDGALAEAGERFLRAVAEAQAAKA